MWVVLILLREWRLRTSAKLRRLEITVEQEVQPGTLEQFQQMLRLELAKERLWRHFLWMHQTDPLEKLWRHQADPQEKMWRFPCGGGVCDKRTTELGKQR